MTKDQVTALMIKKANQMLATGWTRDAENELWTLASENDVFMCEYYDDDDRLCGFYINDDYWKFNF